MLVKARKHIVTSPQDAQEVLSRVLGTGSQGGSMMEEEYLTVEDLSRRIRFSKQTIYNMISSKKFVRGQHYLKPSRKKVLFLWSGIREWLEDQNQGDDESTSGGVSTTDHSKSLIQI